MISVSEQVAVVIDSSSRTFLSRFLIDETEISGSVQSVKVYKGSCGETQFTPGSIYSSYIEVVLNYCTESLEGKELLYQIGVVVDDETEWYDIGYYTVNKPSTNVYTTSFTGLGRLSAKMGGLYRSKLTFPASIQSVLNEISEDTGVLIDASAFNTNGFIETKPTGYMYREMLAYIAGIFFGYATEDNAGKIVFAKFRTTGNTVNTDGDRTSVLPTFSDLDTEITGIKVVVSEGSSDEDAEEDSSNEVSFSSGTVNISISNPFMTQDLFNLNVSNIIGFTYKPGTVTISMGDFRLEAFDCMNVTDLSGQVHIVPCMSVVHTFDGGISTEIIAPGLENEESDTSAFRGSLTQNVERMQVDLATINELVAKKITADEADLKYASIEKANILEADIEKVTGDLADFKSGEFEDLKSKQADFETTVTDDLEAKKAQIEDLETTRLKTEEFSAQVAKLDVATIAELFTNIGFLNDFVAGEGHITGTLAGVHINGDTIEGNTIKADSLILKGSDGLYYQLNANSGTLTSEQLTEDQYKEKLDGSVLVEHSITANEITTEKIMGAGGWINLYEATFSYQNAETGNGISWDGKKLSINVDELYIGAHGVATKQDVDNATNAIEEELNTVREEVTTLLKLESSRGMAFKNNSVSTTLSPVIYHGSKRILDIDGLHEAYGTSAYLQWSWRRLDDDRYGLISADDSRLSAGGFLFEVSPDDVDTQVTIMCELITD